MSAHKLWNQNVKINNNHCLFQVLSSGVPWGSIPGSILFNIFLKDLYPRNAKTDLLNSVGENTVSAAKRTIEDLI